MRFLSLEGLHRLLTSYCLILEFLFKLFDIGKVILLVVVHPVVLFPLLLLELLEIMHHVIKSIAQIFVFVLLFFAEAVEVLFCLFSLLLSELFHIKSRILLV